MKTIQKYLKSITALTLIVMSSLSFAQQGINYQGVARTANGDLMTSTDITLDVNINKTTEDGDIIYSESHDLITDANGVFSLVIGQGTPLLNLFEDINWAETKHFLNVWLDGEEIGTTEFKAVPYSQAIGKFQAHNNGLTTKGTGGSIYIGDNAGEFDDFTDNHNIGFGENALQATTEGWANIALGKDALIINRSGFSNVALGHESLSRNTTGYSNIALGFHSLFNNDGGNDNIALGWQSLLTNSEGENNIALGEDVLFSNLTGNHNTSIGFNSLHDNTNGNYNIALGKNALYSNTTADNNIAIGTDALLTNTIGNNNIALGIGSLYDNTIGFNNIALGANAMRENSSGSNNIAFGENAMGEKTSGTNNVAIGKNALLADGFGSNNFAAGEDALRNASTAQYNIAIGSQSQLGNVQSEHNISLGRMALKSTLASAHNVAIGSYSLENHITGVANVVIGTRALGNHIDGHNNVAIGSSSLYTNLNGANNVSLGIRAGYSSLGNNSVFIGFEAGKNDFNGDKLYIESSDSDTPLIYGDFEDDVLGFYAKVGIGTKGPSVPLHVTGGTDLNLADETGFFVIGNENVSNLVMDSNEIQARNGGDASDLYLQNEGGNVRVGGAIVHASDRRLKRDIEELSYGLQEILKLRPAEYFWRGKEQENKSLGLIAQEVEDVIKNVVTYNKEQDRYGVSYTELIPVLIKALQEQQNIIKNQNTSIKDFENRLMALEQNLNNN